MKYKDGRKYVRKLGQARKDRSIYANLGHPDRVVKKNVVFILKDGKSYSLTPGKSYNILACKFGKFHFDKSLRNRVENERDCEHSQGEDYLIIIINDLGHKRKYSHSMFRKEVEINGISA